MPRRRPSLTVAQILAWADNHHARTGEWPNSTTGRLLDNLYEKWLNIDKALRLGIRGLPGGDSLALLLARRLAIRNRASTPRLTIKQILAWAKAHYVRTGRWPQVRSGAIHDAPGETWCAVEDALRYGLRGLKGGSSLARLLSRRLGVRSARQIRPRRRRRK